MDPVIHKHTPYIVILINLAEKWAKGHGGCLLSSRQEKKDFKIVDPNSRESKQVIITTDDGIRPDTSMSVLAKLKPAFTKDGTTAAGNSSQISDGAGAVLLMRREIAMKKGLPILGVFRSFVAVGVEPSVMGVGPAVAIPATVEAAGLQLNEIDLFEINEVAILDARYQLAESRDYEVKVAFLQLAVSSGCKEYHGEVESTLKQVGRMKYLHPLYTALYWFMALGSFMALGRKRKC